MNLAKRPASVSIIAAIIILIGSMKLILAPLGFTVPKIQRALEVSGMPLNTAVLWQLVFGVILVASGVAILKGLNWGRWLYLGIVPVSVLLSWIIFKFDPRHILGLTIWVALLVVLLNTPASEFFTKN